MKKDGTMKWGKLLEEVENPGFRPGRGSRFRSEKIPLAVVAVAGDKTQQKRDLVNAMLVDWQISQQWPSDIIGATTSFPWSTYEDQASWRCQHATPKPVQEQWSWAPVTLVSDSLRHDTEMDKVRRREQYWYDMQHFQQFEEANKRARRRKRKSSPRDDFNFGKRKFDENRRFSH